jgi:hypothetical protein
MNSYSFLVILQKLAELAERTLKSGPESRQTLIVTKFEDDDLLWGRALADEDDEEWNLIGSFTFTTPKVGRDYPLRGVTIRGVPEKTIRNLHYPNDSVIPEGLEKRVNDVLLRISEEEAKSMTLRVSLDDEAEKYHVHMIDESGKTLEIVEFESTKAVIEMLRRPLSSGEYFRSTDGILYSWNPMANVIYDEVKVKSGLLSLSFLRPLVENPRIFDGMYVVPKGAKEVLETELGEEVLMLARPDMERYRKGWKKCWNIWFVKKHIGEDFEKIQQQYVTIQDVGLFFECKQIVDMVTGKRHPTRIVIEKLNEVSLPSEVKNRDRIKILLDSM